MNTEFTNATASIELGVSLSPFLGVLGDLLLGVLLRLLGLPNVRDVGQFLQFRGIDFVGVVVVVAIVMMMLAKRAAMVRWMSREMGQPRGFVFERMSRRHSQSAKLGEEQEDSLLSGCWR